MNRIQAEAEALKRWGRKAFADVVADSEFVNKHYVVGNGDGVTGFGFTWAEAFADADKAEPRTTERRAAPPGDPGGGTPVRGGRRSVKTLNRDPKNRGKKHE